MIFLSKAIKNLAPSAEYILKDNKVNKWLSTDIPQPSDAEIEAEVARLIAEQPAKEARAKRDRLLTESDWVAVRAVDAGDSVPAGWREYRQALRDVPEQTGFPENIDWPQIPGIESEKPES